jgi:hypothetical protein
VREGLHRCLAAAAALDPDNDDGFTRAESALLAALRGLDAECGDDDFWTTAAEEIGLGTAAVPAAHPRPSAPTATEERTLVVLPDDERDRLFTRDAWTDLTSLTPVTIVRAPHLIAAAVDIVKQTAISRSRPTPRFTALVVTAAAILDEAVFAALPDLRILCLVGDSASAAPVPARSGVRVKVLDGDSPGHAVVAALRSFD